MVTLQASGLAGNKKIVKEDADFKKFYQALEFVCIDLAKKIVQDGEGATKFLTINVKGAPSIETTGPLNCQDHCQFCPG